MGREDEHVLLRKIILFLYLLGDLWKPFFRKVLKDRSNVIIKVHYPNRSALEIVLWKLFLMKLLNQNSCLVYNNIDIITVYRYNLIKAGDLIDY